VQRYAYGASIIGFAVEAAIVVTTLFASKPVVPSWLLVPLFVGSLAVIAATVVVYRNQPADFWRGGLVFYTVGILLWVFAIVSLYQLKDAKDPFTHQEQLAQQRVVSAVPAFFYLVGIAARRRRDG
jgi:peptidoglycan/LPS O-acetylase OafA/YrhL